MSITNAPSVTAEEWPDQPRFHPFDYPEDEPAFDPDAVLRSINDICDGWHAGRWRDEFYAVFRGPDYSVIVRAGDVQKLTARIAEIDARRPL